jgi:hypothetical protein
MLSLLLFCVATSKDFMIDTQDSYVLLKARTVATSPKKEDTTTTSVSNVNCLHRSGQIRQLAPTFKITIHEQFKCSSIECDHLMYYVQPKKYD